MKNLKNQSLIIAILAFLLQMFARQVAQACDLCSVYLGREVQGQLSQGFYAGTSEQFTHFGTLKNNGHEVPNVVNQYVESSTTQIFLGYNFLEGLGLQVNLPIITRHYQRPNGFLMEKGDVSGIGDLSTHLNWTLTNQFKNDVHVSLRVHGGVKFPTGSADRIAEELSETESDANPPPPESGIHGHDLALGSGSYDGIFGSEVFLVWKRVFLSGGLQYAARSRGSFQYRYADDFTWNGGPGIYLVTNHSCTLSAQALASGERKGLDDLNGTPAEDTGISAVYVGPQVSFTWSDWLSLETGADLPVLQNNTALQIVPDYRIRFGLTFRL